METLPLNLRKNGFDYTQILRGKKSCIYEQRVSESEAYFEVFLIRIIPERTIVQKKIGVKERFPHNEAGGKWLWIFRDFEEALFRFNELEEGKTNKDFKHYLKGTRLYH